MKTAIQVIVVFLLIISLDNALTVALPELHGFYRYFIVIFLAYKLTPSDFFE
jgi:hypothetical protein